MSMRFIRLLSQQHTNPIHTDGELYKTTDTDDFAFLHSCGLESRSKSHRLVSHEEFSKNLSLYHV